MYKRIKISVVVFTAFLLLLSVNSIWAHCDSVNGPVVQASKKAIETGNLNHVLIWVGPKDEAEVKSIFEKVLNVRKQSESARELADNYFFETVVRLHRMGEGVGYTGLKQADYKPEEGIEAADKAIENNSAAPLLQRIKTKDQPKVKELFADLQAKKKFELNDINAGRRFVAAYVQFIHHIEALYAGKKPAHDAHHH